MDWFLYDNGLRHEKVKYKIFKNICILFDVELMRMIRDWPIEPFPHRAFQKVVLK